MKKKVIRKLEVTQKQLGLLQANISKVVELKADRVLGVGRTPVKLVSVHVDEQYAVIHAQWDEQLPWSPNSMDNTTIEEVNLSSFVKLY